MTIVPLAMSSCALLAAGVGMQWRKRQRQLKALLQFERSQPWLVAYASQTGSAERIARESASLLQADGWQVVVLPLERVRMELLLQTTRALFVISNWGSGSAPEHAQSCLSTLLNQCRVLSQLQYGLLGLGDDRRRPFCGFSRQVDQWLRSQGATPIFPMIELNRNQQSAQQSWFSNLNAHLELPLPAESQLNAHLLQRVRLNPASTGSPLYRITLLPDKPLHWQSGDLLDVWIDDDDSPRAYMLASLPEDGRLDILVRHSQSASGTRGQGAAWLCQGMAVGAQLRLQVRSNPSFHLPAAGPLILIGDGTGIASLHAHLRKRAHQGQYQNWLVFGEHNGEQGILYADDIDRWQRQGHLLYADQIPGTDPDGRGRIVSLMRERASELQRWVRAGATVLVSGSFTGLGQPVEQGLREVLGGTLLNTLRRNGRYRRLLY